jgi:predicted ATP-grasp superfamily ATP-dependent carboligase
MKASLAVEGAAMLRALAADAAAVPNWRVVVTWDAALPPFGVANIEVCAAHSPEEEHALFRRLAAEAEATLVIAPEFERLLESRCRLIAECGGHGIGPTPEAIALCGDKLALAKWLTERGIRTIPTERYETARLDTHLAAVGTDGLVVKPRFGAGSMHTFHVTQHHELREVADAYATIATGVEAIVQPFVRGIALSVAGVVSPERIDLFPPCRQRIEGRRLHYAGGRLPAETGHDDLVADIARRAIDAVPGLFGYVGVDLILPDDEPRQPVVVEINPRLTSSYHGYRALATENLAERILAPGTPRRPLAWKNGIVQFLPDGT